MLDEVDGVENIVYQENYEGEENDSVEVFADFLRCINDDYGPSTSRYSPKRIHITVNPGDKFQGGK